MCPSTGAQQALVFARQLTPEPACQDKHRQAEDDRSGRHLSHQDQGVKARVQKIGNIRAARGAAQSSAPKHLFDERIDECKVEDERGPVGGVQADRLNIRGKVPGDAKGGPEEMQKDPAASGKEDAQEDPPDIVASEESFKRQPRLDQPKRRADRGVKCQQPHPGVPEPEQPQRDRQIRQDRRQPFRRSG